MKTVYQRLDLKDATRDLVRLRDRVHKRTGFIFPGLPQVEVYTNGVFTVATAAYLGQKGLGVAKRMATDVPNLTVGANIAVVRALEDLVARIKQNNTLEDPVWGLEAGGGA